MARESASSFVEAAGIRFFVTRKGSGPPVFLLHGGPGLWDYLGDVGDALSDVCETAGFDQRGCGRSEGGVHGLSRAVSDVAALGDALGFERFALLGHSWGASLALAVALAHPDRVTGVVYACGVGVDPNWRDTFNVRFAALARDWPEPLPPLSTIELAPRDERPALTLDVFTKRWAIELVEPSGSADRARTLIPPGIVPAFHITRELSLEAATTLEGPGIVHRARSLRVPFLFLHGDGDPRPVESVRRLVDALPSAELVQLSAAGHFPWLDDPNAFYPRIRNFIQALPRD